MLPTTLIPATYLLDQLLGDPESFPHPVRLIGHAITTGERTLRRPTQTPTTQFLLGATLTVTIVSGTYYLTCQLLRLPQPAELLLAWTTLAARNLHQEAAAVLKALEADDLPLARTRLARIVGRDTATLPTPEIARALIETLAESASDGILAPLFYLTLGGVPLAMAYKAVNTLDSMIGHRDHRYEHFGKFAARLDDLANFLPARLTALAIAAVATPSPALRLWIRDGHLHKSPNAGQPEAAIAGALRTRLGGPNTYSGELLPTPILAAEFPPPTPAQARQALHLVTQITLLAVAAATLFSWQFRSRRK